MNIPRPIEDLLAQAEKCVDQNRLLDALKLLDEALTRDPAHLLSLWNRSVVFLRMGNLDAALRDLYTLLRNDPGNVDARNQIRFIHKKVVPSWHFDMMNDEGRNAAYEGAIKKLITPGMVVFEIGTGSGLLSMMAARAGARHVYTCEKSMPIRTAAREIIRKNGFSDKITVIDKWSPSVKIPDDMPEKADLIIAEIFGPGLFEEQALHFFDDARTRLLKPGGKILPHSATIHGALFESVELSKKAFVGTVLGFDLSLFNGLHDEASLQLPLQKHEHRLLSEAEKVEEVSFSASPRPSPPESVAFKVLADGVCHGIVQWFRLATGAAECIDTSPLTPRTHWDQYLQLFEKPLEVKAGQRVTFSLKHFSDRISYRLAKVES